MELPHLGKHCSKVECKQLDFLPTKCDACHEIFCTDHVTYRQHQCQEVKKRDNRVPVCPLCKEPISVMKGQNIDLIVGRHIDNDCKSDTANQKRKVYRNKCSKQGCKQKELIPVECIKCYKNFCLKHRHTADHSCQGNQGRQLSRAGLAAVLRTEAFVKQQTGDGNMSCAKSAKAEMLSKATTKHFEPKFTQTMCKEETNLNVLAATRQENPEITEPKSFGVEDQEAADEALARAIAASEEEALQERRKKIIAVH